MSRNVDITLKKLYKEEQKLLKPRKSTNDFQEIILKKVPDNLQDILEKAFYEAFSKTFFRGSKLIEKTISKEKISEEFSRKHKDFEGTHSKKHLKELKKISKNKSIINQSMTTATGLGLGVLGIGLPDIFLFVSTVIKGIFEISLSFGIDFDSDLEKIYILRLIKTSIFEGDEKILANIELNNIDLSKTSYKDEMESTSKALAHELLAMKFIQGMPIIGVLGGISNAVTFNKITKFAKIKYNIRYLENIQKPTC